MNAPLFSGWQKTFFFFQFQFLFIEIIADLHAIVGNNDPSVCWEWGAEQNT